jgi:hypothetical protein
VQPNKLKQKNHEGKERKSKSNVNGNGRKKEKNKNKNQKSRTEAKHGWFNKGLHLLFFYFNIYLIVIFGKIKKQKKVMPEEHTDSVCSWARWFNKDLYLSFSISIFI